MSGMSGMMNTVTSDSMGGGGSSGGDSDSGSSSISKGNKYKDIDLGENWLQVAIDRAKVGDIRGMNEALDNRKYKVSVTG